MYDQCGQHGAILATAHEHSYCRTKQMEVIFSFLKRLFLFPLFFVGFLIFPSLSLSLSIQHTPGGFAYSEFDFRESLPDQIVLAQNKSVCWVSGVGGLSVRGYYENLQNNPWWAATASSFTGLNYGALFCTFNKFGVLRNAEVPFFFSLSLYFEGVIHIFFLQFCSAILKILVELFGTTFIFSRITVQMKPLSHTNHQIIEQLMFKYKVLLMKSIGTFKGMNTCFFPILPLNKILPIIFDFGDWICLWRNILL